MASVPLLSRLAGASEPERLDVVVIGGGMAGISAAYRLQTDSPRSSFAVLERRARIGGTWDLNRFPGVRSDSPMWSYAFPWQPWKEPAEPFGQGPSILKYLDDAVADHGLGQHIRKNVDVQRADFSSTDQCWHLQTSSGPITTRFLLACTGYYQYDPPNMPEIVGLEQFAGRVEHPQHWPQDLDVSGQNVVILGSGATAITMGPELAKTAASVTIIQRTPSYMINLPRQERLLTRLVRSFSPEMANALNRRLATWDATRHYIWCMAFPKRAKAWHSKHALDNLGGDMKGCKMPDDFPWKRRVCVDPDGLMFQLIREEKVRIVTDTVREATSTGIVCNGSGAELKADLIVTATGFHWQKNYPMNNIVTTVDGKEYSPPDSMMYKSVMLSGMPNIFFTGGYFHASYTQRVDIQCSFATRVIDYMREHGLGKVVVQRDPSVPELNPDLLPTAGYFRRSLAANPKFPGERTKWATVPDPHVEGLQLRREKLENGLLEFSAL